MQASRIRLHLFGPRGAQTLKYWMTERRNTQRKQAVINAVKQVQSPFTVEQLFHMAKRLVPGVSRATVYRTICILRDEGSVKEVCLPHGKRIFAHTDADVLCVMECEDCGRFTTFPDGELSAQLAIVARERHLSPMHASVYVRGRCQDWCATGRCPQKERSP
jgi:Fe2+ or Zn2+ uptake regulation protein